MKISNKALKTVAVTSSVLALARLAYPIMLSVALRRFAPEPFHSGEAASIGIIGGADGSTAIYVVSKAFSFLDYFFWLCVISAVASGIMLLFRRNKKIK